MIKFISTLNNCIKRKKFTFYYYKFSKKIIKLLFLLTKNGLIREYKFNKNYIEIKILNKNNQSVIKNIKTIKANNYIKKKKIKFNLNSIFILSTNCGLMTDKQAKFLNLGGKLVCKILC